MKKWFYLFLWLMFFSTSLVSADPVLQQTNLPTIPNYNWETSFETINSENDLLLITPTPEFPYLNTDKPNSMYWAKNAGIYRIDSSPIVHVFYIFNKNKLVSIYLVIYDENLYHRFYFYAFTYTNRSFADDMGSSSHHFDISSKRTIATFPFQKSGRETYTIILTDKKYTSVKERDESDNGY